MRKITHWANSWSRYLLEPETFTGFSMKLMMGSPAAL